MKTLHTAGFLLLMAFLAGCVEDSDLHRTIFIRDKQHPDLPQYSEWGYNTFGAYMNDEVFISGDDYGQPASVSTSDTAMTLSFYGKKISNRKDTTDLTLTFFIPRNTPRDERYLLSLNDEEFDLANSSTRVLITSGATTNQVTINSGKFLFTRVQNLIVDNTSEETILSGTFEFEGFMEGEPLSVTWGRFDVGISNYYY